MADKLYGLFKPVRLPNGRYSYERVAGTNAYHKPVAVRMFQDRLIYEDLCLRPVKTVSQPASAPANVQLGQCMPCYKRLHTTCERGECRCNCRMFQKGS